MEIIDQKILHDSVRWPLSPLYEVRTLPGEIKKEESAAGDIVIANEDGVKKIIKQSEYTTNSALYTENGYQPIAVVVVPASHTPDGTARCMALEFVRNNSSDDQTVTTGIDIGGSLYFGNSDSICLTYYSDGKQFPDGLEDCKLENGINYRVPGTTTTTQAIKLGSPSSGGTGGTYTGGDPIATVTHYTPAISPYGTDGISKNPDLFVEGGITDYMDGYGNTQKIIEHVVNTFVAYNSENADKRQYDVNIQPAPWNAHLYHTFGTIAGSGATMGDWYLPSICELFYIPSRSEQIADGIRLARGFDTNTGVAGAVTSVSPTYSNSIWSSTASSAEGNIWNFWAESIASGHYVYRMYVYSGGGVIPFIKI